MQSIKSFKRIGILGGLGFIASNFLRYMEKKYPDLDFVVVDKIGYASGEDGYSTSNIQDLLDKDPVRFRFIKADITDKDAMREALYLCDGVVNFAAESHVGRAMVDGKRHLYSNDIGAVTVGEVCCDYHIRLCHISTDEVYGDLLEGSFREDIQFNPRNRYAASKAAAEMNLRALTFAPHNLDLVVTRSANNFGKYQSQEKFVHVIAECIAKNRPITIHGEGKEVREWLYVLDNCSAIDKVLHEGTTGEAYNISSHNEVSNLDLAKLAIKHFGGTIAFVPNRPGNDRRYSIDTSKIEKMNWKPIAINGEFEKVMVESIRYYIQKHTRNVKS